MHNHTGNLFDATLPEPALLDVKMQDPVTGGHFVSAQTILHPHVVFSWLSQLSACCFFAWVVTDLNAVTRFWKSIPTTTQYVEHSVRKKRNHKKRATPTFLHGDGVPVVGVGKAWSKLVDVWSWAVCCKLTETQWELTYETDFFIPVGRSVPNGRGGRGEGGE